MEIFSSLDLSFCEVRLAQFLLNNFSTPPVILCLGTDRLLADSLGPLTAEFLRKENYPNFIYGGLKSPITRQSAEFATNYINTMHPASQLLVIDSMATASASRLGHIIASKSYTGALQNLNLSANLFLYGITNILHNNLLKNSRLENIFSLSQILSKSLKLFSQKSKENNLLKNPQKA